MEYIRLATTSDIKELQRIRVLVRENVLSDPSKVTDEDCVRYLTERGRGWVYEKGGVIMGFAIIDFLDPSIWALFVDPEYEGMGIGNSLHATMLESYFHSYNEKLWLTTEAGTRAERFYRDRCWESVDKPFGKEIRFEMSLENWSACIKK